MIGNLRELWEAYEDLDMIELAVIDNLNVNLILTSSEDGDLLYTRARYDDDETEPIGWVREDNMEWPLRRLVPEVEPADDTPCGAEMWSWDYFRSEQVDSYRMRCHLIGAHDEHENSENGAKWPNTESGDPSSEVDRG